MTGVAIKSTPAQLQQGPVEKPPLASDPDPGQQQAVSQATEFLWQVGRLSNDPEVQHAAIHAAILMERKQAAGRILCRFPLPDGDAVTEANEREQVSSSSAFAEITRFTRDPGNWVVVSSRRKVPGYPADTIALAAILMHESVHCVQECDTLTFPIGDEQITAKAKKAAGAEVPAYCLQEKLLCDLVQGNYFSDALAAVYGGLSPAEVSEILAKLPRWKDAATDLKDNKKTERDC